jgi:hypothetical protein
MFGKIRLRSAQLVRGLGHVELFRQASKHRELIEGHAYPP